MKKNIEQPFSDAHSTFTEFFLIVVSRQVSLSFLLSFWHCLFGDGIFEKVSHRA